MADNHSFDIVSEVNTAEMHNAVVQAQHEIAVRYDFKGTKASIEYDKKDNKLTLLANDKGQLETVVQMLKETGGNMAAAKIRRTLRLKSTAALDIYLFGGIIVLIKCQHDRAIIGQSPER